MATVRPSGAERRQVIRPCPRGETPYVGWSGPDLRWTACSGEAPAVAVVGADGESHPVAGVVLGPVVDGALTWVVADDGLERIGEDGVVTSVPLADDVVAVSGASRLWAGGGHVVLDQPLEDDRRQLVVLDDVGTELTRLDYQSYRVSREPSPRIARLAVTDAGAWFSFAERLWWLPLP